MKKLLLLVPLALCAQVQVDAINQGTKQVASLLTPTLSSERRGRRNSLSLEREKARVRVKSECKVFGDPITGPLVSSITALCGVNGWSRKSCLAARAASF